MNQKALDPAAVNAAIEWMVALRFNAAEPAMWARFDTWRTADPAHDAAWQRMEAMQADFPRGSHVELTRNTLSSLYDHRGSRRRALKVLGGLGLFGASLVLVRETTPWQRLVADYSTAYGESRRWELTDGTEVVLNTDSAIDVSFSDTLRRIRLLRGEIQLITGADSAASSKRTLRVETVYGAFEPIGTTFLLALKPKAVELSVQQGAVALRLLTQTTSVLARAGETWSVNASTAARLLQVRSEPGAWLRGTLVIEDMPLGDLMAELNRYRGGYLKCDDRVADRRVTAVVQLNDIDRALDFLAASYGLKITRYTKYWTTVTDRVRAA